MTFRSRDFPIPANIKTRMEEKFILFKLPKILNSHFKRNQNARRRKYKNSGCCGFLFIFVRLKKELLKNKKNKNGNKKTLYFGSFFRRLLGGDGVWKKIMVCRNRVSRCSILENFELC